MNRRTFIQKGGLGGFTVLAVPHIFIKNNTMNERIIGHHSHRYRVIEGWGVLDAGRNPVNDCHEMVEDASGRLILLTNETKNNILIYDKSGRLLEVWGTNYPGAHGLTLVDEGGEQFLFITDTERNQVVKTDLKGKVLLKLDYPRESGVYEYPGQYKPTETAIDPATGHIYVADGYGLNYILKYSPTGEYMGHFGGAGDTDDTFRCCHGIIVDTRQETPGLIITNRSHMELKRFSLEGTYQSTISVPGSFICRPVIHGDHIFAAVYRSTSQQYPNSGYITILDEHDRVVSTPGGTEPVYVNGQLQEQRKDTSFALFRHPHDVCVDRDGNLYIPQWASGKTYPVKLERV